MGTNSRRRPWRVEVDSKGPEITGSFTGNFERKLDAIRFASRFLDLKCSITLVSPGLVRTEVMRGIVTGDGRAIAGREWFDGDDQAGSDQIGDGTIF